MDYSGDSVGMQADAGKTAFGLRMNSSDQLENITGRLPGGVLAAFAQGPFAKPNSCRTKAYPAITAEPGVRPCLTLTIRRKSRHARIARRYSQTT
jgi:hypothetical protein